MASEFLYTITTGRSGTVFLTELLRANLPSARVYHERVGFPNFGVNTPDASHFTTFNNIGVTPEIRSFWKQKLERDATSDAAMHAEASHFLAKAGLMENLDLLGDASTIHIVALRRDPLKILWSYLNRFDFFNSGFTWLFTLDIRYPNTIICSDPFQNRGMAESALWYVWEMFARMAYYRCLFRDHPKIKFHDVWLEQLTTPEGARAFISSLIGNEPDDIKLPEKQNATQREFFGQDVYQKTERIFEQFRCDPDALGQEFFQRGLRLGTPVHLMRRVLPSARQP